MSLGLVLTVTAERFFTAPEGFPRGSETPGAARVPLEFTVLKLGLLGGVLVGVEVVIPKSK